MQAKVFIKCPTSERVCVQVRNREVLSASEEYKHRVLVQAKCVYGEVSECT